VPAEAARKGWVWPAQSEDRYSGQYGGGIPLGTLFAIPPGIDVTKLGLSTDGVVLARALQDYGVYVGDTSSPGSATNIAMLAEPSPGAGQQVWNMNAALPTLHRLLRPVTNNAPSAIGGGGTPRQPLAAPLP